MSSAMAAVFDYLLAQLPARVKAVDANAVVVDGPCAPCVAPPNTTMVFVGATSPVSPTALDGTRLYVQLGRRAFDEDFYVPCYIDAATGDRDQAKARNLALAQMDVVTKLVADDLTLGGCLLAGRYAELTDIQMIQTDEDDEPEGRRCVIGFRVHCTNHYTP